MGTWGLRYSFIFISLISTLNGAWAADPAQDKYDEAKTLYVSRADAAKLQAGMDAADKALTLVQDKDLKYDILLLSCKFFYFKGMHAQSDNEKVDIFEKGRLKAESARTLMDDPADAYYWSAASLARWGEAKGVLAALSKKNELLKLLNAIPDKTTHDSNPGEAYEGNGYDRILGRVYYKLPAFAGGDPVKSLELLKTAYDNAKDFGINIVYYAEALSGGDADQKKQAKQILDDFLKLDPEKINPNRIPENKDEYADAKKLRAELGD